MDTSRKRDSQERLGKPTEDNIPISPEIITRKKPEKGERKRRWVPRQTTPFKVLKEEAARVLDASIRKSRVIPDSNLYFVLTFFSSFRSPAIRKFLETSELVPVSTSGDYTAKLRISRTRYESFLTNLQKYSAFVRQIKETTLQEKVQENLLSLITAYPEKKVRINIEIPQTKDRESTSKVLEELQRYLLARNLGSLEKTYLSDRFILVTGELPAKNVQEIAENLDAISRISLASVIKLQSSQSNGNSSKQRKRLMRLQSLAVSSQLIGVPADLMPTVLILDSGINRDHGYVKPYVLDTYDFTSGGPLPCEDTLGHGTLVAGVAIYGGDVTLGSPSARVIAVKICDSHEFGGNTIELIRDTVQKFKNRVRVINLSFATDYPDPAYSKALDDLSFNERVLFVACTGNIPTADIMHELNKGNAYPFYLANYHVFFPGDCFNVLTVGSLASKGSNLVLDGHPSPFTRTSPFKFRLKPEFLASGGNVNVVKGNSQVVSANWAGCGIVLTANNDSQLLEAVGTSFSSPAIASIVASLIEKWSGQPPCFYKAMIVSSCQRLVDRTGREFDSTVQGFGVPSRENALGSVYWRINLFSSAEFDLTNLDQFHRYRFLVPDNADVVKITLCFDVEPLLDSELPYEVVVKLHKPGPRFSTASVPNVVIPGGSSNVRQYEFHVKRGGRGFWTLDLSPTLKPALLLERLDGKRLRYGLVVTVYSTQRLEVYNKVAASVKPRSQK